MLRASIVLGLCAGLAACGPAGAPGDAAHDAAHDAAAPRDADDAGSDAGSDASSALCPGSLPVTGTPCAADPTAACVYGASGCGATYSYRRCACVDAGWRCPCLAQ